VVGSKQQPGIDYEQTFAPVASWASIRLIVLLAVINKGITKQLGFVQAFPQAPVESPLFMKIPKGCNVSEGDDDWVLEILNNIYRQRQAGKVWYDYLTKGLIIELGFIQSEHDPCILWRGTCIIIIYTDAMIIMGPDEEEINKAIVDIAKHYEITHKNSASDFLGVNMQREEDKKEVTLTQQRLIQSILKDLNLDGTPKT
jgi:Reverse transcriptase (RNA-dependent DNA polymerase)